MNYNGSLSFLAFTFPCFPPVVYYQYYSQSKHFIPHIISLLCSKSRVPHFTHCKITTKNNQFSGVGSYCNFTNGIKHREAQFLDPCSLANNSRLRFLPRKPFSSDSTFKCDNILFLSCKVSKKPWMFCTHSIHLLPTGFSSPSFSFSLIQSNWIWFLPSIPVIILQQALFIGLPFC